MHLSPHSQASGFPADDRQEDRRPLRLWVNVSTPDYGSHAARLLNLSPTGLLIATEELRLREGAPLSLHLPGGKVAEAEAVWSSGNLTGLNFHEPLSDGAVATLLLRAEPRGAEEGVVEALPRRSRRRTSLWPERGFGVPVVLAGVFWVVIAAWAAS